MTQILRLEICVDTVEGVELAAAHGADRIELCASLGVGGLTPSVGMMRLAAEVDCPTRAMIRPREGDFVYSLAELTMMQHDIDAVAAHGLEGVVFGVNRVNGELDEDSLYRLVSHAKAAALKVTLHRSFDVTPDLNAALATARSLQVDTILTSGGAQNALLGADKLSRLMQALETSPQLPSLELMAGGGVRAETAPEIVARSGVTWLHGSCSRRRSDLPPPIQQPIYGLFEYRRTDAEAIDRLRAVLGELTQQPAISD